MSSSTDNNSGPFIAATMTERSHGDEMMVRSRLGPFEIKYPPVKKRMVAGHLVPSLRTAGRFLMAKKRRLSLEILSPYAEQGLAGVEEWNPAPKELQDQDRVVVRVLRAARRGEEDDSDDHNDDDSVNTVDSGDDFVDKEGKLWKTTGEHPSDDIVILKGGSKNVEVKIGTGNDTVVRDFKFSKESDAAKFEKGLMIVKQLESARTKRQIKLFKDESKASLTSGGNSTRGGMDFSMSEEINLLVEIVSAIDLPAADMTTGSSDPYVVVKMKGSKIHQTDSISKNLQPIWTLDTGSLFLIRMAPEEFFASASGINFIVKDYDAVGTDDILGTADVPLKEALAGKGERTPYALALSKGCTKSGSKPKLFLRFKQATKEDIEFMESFKGSPKKHGVYSEESFLPFNAPERKLLKRQEKKGPTKDLTLFRAKPGPDPAREEDETKWMTWDNIKKESLKPSTNWIEAGSGDVGKLFLEILGCDGLPNMDSTAGLNMGDKTDAFCCVVYEDCIVNTDVIGNTLNPRWLPWSQRAFAFNISCPSSLLFIGVFDHDPEMGAGQVVARGTGGTVHDPIGRLVINTTNFVPGTLYNLKYTLYYGELAAHRQKPMGTLSIRLRLDFPNAQKAMIEAMKPPVENLVAVDRKVDFAVSNYTADGAVDDLDFSLTTITAYIDELVAYLDSLDVIMEALMIVVLWHPTFSVTKTLKIPLHSITAFVWGVAVTWNYNFLPSFWLFCIGWILLACNESTRSHPSRWNRCPEYPAFLQRLVFGTTSPEKLQPATKADIEAIKKYETQIAETKESKKKEKLERDEKEAKYAAEMLAEQEKAEEEEQVGGKKGGLKIDPTAALLKPSLYPVQKQLRGIVHILRVVKNVVFWGEAYYTFWIVTACFAGSLLLIWVPWSFFIRWSLRLGAFFGLGPWMYLVDKYYLKTNWDMTKEERETALREQMKTRYEEVLASTSIFMVRKEAAMKMKRMKQYMFGKFLVRVPQFREDVYDDIPLPSSSCEPFWLSKKPVDVKKRMFGQQLAGDMIPQREVQCVKKAEPAPKKRSMRFLKATGKGLSEKVPLLGKNRTGYKSTNGK